jgi:hypothetical protein
MNAMAPRIPQQYLTGKPLCGREKKSNEAAAGRKYPAAFPDRNC